MDDSDDESNDSRPARKHSESEEAEVWVAIFAVENIVVSPPPVSMKVSMPLSRYLW